MSSTPNTPGLTLAQVTASDTSQWKLIVKQALAKARVATPAFLTEDINGSAQTVTVQIAIQERVRYNGQQQWLDVPPIINVPILLPRGGGFSVTLPLKKGDQGMLIFCDTCFDNWWLHGQQNAPPAQNPKPVSWPIPSGTQRQLEVRRHHVHDCGFFPGMWSQNNLLSDYSTDSLQIRSDDGNTIIDVAEAGVTISGASVTAKNDGMALALVNDTFYQWFVTNIMPYLATLSPPYTGPAVPTGSETTILKGQ